MFLLHVTKMLKQVQHDACFVAMNGYLPLSATCHPKRVPVPLNDRLSPWTRFRVLELYISHVFNYPLLRCWNKFSMTFILSPQTRFRVLELYISHVFNYLLLRCWNKFSMTLVLWPWTNTWRTERLVVTLNSFQGLINPHSTQNLMINP